MRGAKILEISVRCLALTTLILTGITPLLAQDKPTASFLEFRYGIQLPAGDMKDRFGSSMDLGVDYNLVGVKSKLFAGVDGIFFFGNGVKEDVLAGLRSYDGAIVGIDGRPGDVNLKERGFYGGIHVGKIISTTKKEDNLTGIVLQLGGGLLQHKIRIQDNRSSIVALEKKYLPGYDRLSNGPAVHIATGFFYDHPVNNFQVKILADIYGASTKSRRDFDHLHGSVMTEKRTDILAGLSVSYVVTISRQSSADNIYY